MRKIKDKGKYIFFLASLPLLLVFISPAPYHAQKFKPTNDFSWLKTYASIYYTFSEDQWEKLPDRSFDSLGVHLTKKQYHPVNACHYALFCYDEYIKTKNERFKKAFLAQISYLMDSTKYNKIGNDKIGYPYNFNFHDLKSPWYSALAQSEAISTLIRYYAMTKDEKSLDVIRKLNKFMITPMKDGGMRSETPEGNVWLEEYPNSKQEKQVLNGFFLSIVSLYEYTKLFPDDKEMLKLYTECIESVKNTMHHYDTGSWLRYNRGDKRLVANGYMKWQVNEMQHLYSITNDPYFYKLYMLWTTYAYNKDYVVPGCKVAYYNWSVPLEKSKNQFVVKSKGQDYHPFTVNSIADIYPAKKASASPLFDNNPNTFVAFAMHDTLEKKPFIQLKTSGEVETKMIQVRLLNDTIRKNSLSIYQRSDSAEKWREVKINDIVYSKPSVFEYKFQQLKLTQIKIEFNLSDTQKLQVAEIKVNQVNLNNREPEYYFYQTDTMRFTSKHPVFNCTFTNTDEYLVLYRTSDRADKLKTEPWIVENSTTKLPLTFGDNQCLYQFLIILKRKDNSSGIVGIEWS